MDTFEFAVVVGCGWFPFELLHQERCWPAVSGQELLFRANDTIDRAVVLARLAGFHVEDCFKRDLWLAKGWQLTDFATGNEDDDEAKAVALANLINEARLWHPQPEPFVPLDYDKLREKARRMRPVTLP